MNDYLMTQLVKDHVNQLRAEAVRQRLATSTDSVEPRGRFLKPRASRRRLSLLLGRVGA